MITVPNTISPRVEVTLRVAFVTLVSSILAVANLPTATPTGLSQLIGIFGPTFAVNLPHAAFIVGAAYPSVIVACLIGLLSGTALQAAATVSDGLYVAIFSVFTLYCSALNYGPNASKTAPFSNLLIIAAGMLSLGSWQLVQHGIAIDVHLPLGNSTEHFLSDSLLALEDRICGAASDFAGCAHDLAGLSHPGRQFVIPGDSDLGGQTVSVSCQDSVCTIAIPGGLWLVNGFWTWSGLTNPLAAFQNFLIAFCWALFIICIGILLPPIRTVRSMYTRGLLPAAISDATRLIEANSSDANADETEEEKETLLKKEERETLLKKVVHAAVENANGGMAPLTAYEPRICSNPLECTWPKLKEVASSVNKIALYALGSEVRAYFRERESDEDKKEFDKAVTILKQCSSALMQDNELVVNQRDSAVNVPTQIDEEHGEEKRTFSYFVRTVDRMAKELQSNTAAWLDAMHNPKYTGRKDLLMSYLPWILPIVVLLKSLVLNLLLPFQPKRWNLRAFITATKFSLGVVVLVICEVYWPEYRGFAIGESNRVITDDVTPNVYSGWNLIAYAFSTTPTMEGTIKKGILRFLGTATGGFLAWIGVIICSGSYDETAPVNLYGLVVWLTITTGIVAYLNLPPGPAAFMGMDPSTASYGMYLVMTQALCATEIALGVGTRDKIVSNRVVANLTGVLIAMIVAVIPPQNKGADIEPLKKLLKSVEDTLEAGLRIIIENCKWDGGEIMSELEELREKFEIDAHEEKKKLAFLLKDASKLNAVPLFRVDPRLSEALDSMTVTGVYVLMWLEFAAQVTENDDVKLSDEEISLFKEKAGKILERIQNIAITGAYGVPEEDDDSPALKQIESEREEPDLLLNVASFICAKLEKQEMFFTKMTDEQAKTDGEGWIYLFACFTDWEWWLRVFFFMYH